VRDEFVLVTKRVAERAAVREARLSALPEDARRRPTTKRAQGR
jgi:hypothetical protein